MAIGLVSNDIFGPAIETRNITLHPGDLVVTYTDGITEAMDSDGEEWGTENLIATVERMANASATDLLENIRQGVFAFTGQNRQSDDMTMLALKIK